MTEQLSILGLYNMTGGAVFDRLQLPDGMDAEILIPEILSECSDFALLYPDGDFMQMLIGVWSTKELPIWQAMYDSTQFEYNPIENYDRHEDLTRKVTGTSSADTTSDSTTGSDEKTVTGVTAYNSGEFRDRDQVEARNDTTTKGSGNTTTESSGEEEIHNHVHGNIGVTTAQQMIAGFREISDFSPYDFIVKSFAERFCIQLY